MTSRRSEAIADRVLEQVRGGVAAVQQLPGGAAGPGNGTSPEQPREPAGFKPPLDSGKGS